MRYRSADVASGAYFFIVNLADHNQRLLVEHVEVLSGVMQNMKTAHPFHTAVMAIVNSARKAD